MTTPTEAPREALPESLKVVAWLTDRDLRYLAERLRKSVSAFPYKVNDDERAVVLLTDAQSALESERQAHAAEVERLRADAERYRWLRHGDNDEKVLMVYDTTASRPFDSRYDAAWLPRKEHLDAAIDQAIARGKT